MIESILIFILFLVIGYLSWMHWYDLKRIKAIKEVSRGPKFTWQAMPYGGGAPIIISNVTEEDAVTHCAKNHGTVKYVDRDHHFIFYKPTGA